MFALSDTHLPDPDRQAEFYAGVPTKRALAWVVDTILIALITAVIVPFTVFTALFFLPLLYLFISFTYRVLTLAGGSATPGMRLMNVVMLTRNGERFDLATAFLHTLGYTLSIGTLLVQILSGFLMLTSARGQGLTDHILGTVAINRPR
ncbi:RDD family protein [Gemmobacter fulvus]|uniref:RDD family protein n=1 Tax=Gemmobacter fulvus TaxID=2840474 RepID=A0A975P7A3_9RHOB|nr:RDD family protein [Gemmobacter fulvus]MBT9245356.1 RDD family protein [Gemmobacter fulvus]QWK90328.1 RDD family protein [Gemmobacter fulvus]